MAEDNVKAQMRKGILEYCILAILSREDSYAPKIIAELNPLRAQRRCFRVEYKRLKGVNFQTAFRRKDVSRWEYNTIARIQIGRAHV